MPQGTARSWERLAPDWRATEMSVALGRYISHLRCFLVDNPRCWTKRIEVAIVSAFALSFVASADGHTKA